VLPATGYAVLGLLSFDRSLSGYDLKRWADHSLRYFFWSPAQSAIYSELRRLEDLGYVRAVGSTEGPRARQRYRITAAGRRALAAWVASSTPPPIVKDHALLKVWLGHVTDVDTVRSVVESERKAAEDLLSEIRYSAARAEEAGMGNADLVERCCERIAAARVEALRELSDGVTKRAIARPRG
jgi:DNA-binding PadR family transcriptional regulator